MAKKRPPPKPELRENAIVLELTCDLTEDEILVKGKELAKKLAELDGIEDEKSTAVAEFNRRLKEAAAFTAKLVVQIESRSEVRDVACVEQFNDAEDEVKTIRKDTGEQVSVRAMYDYEHQQEMKLETPEATEA